ncbi:MAG: helix-turn-helix domain-containing protein [Candidatus Binataceae bacterium]
MAWQRPRIETRHRARCDPVCDSATLTAEDLPSEVKAGAGRDTSFTVQLGSSVREVVDELISRTITYVGGNKIRAAQILGVGRRTIYSRLEHYEYETNGSNGRPSVPERPQWHNVTAESCRTSCGLSERSVMNPD